MGVLGKSLGRIHCMAVCSGDGSATREDGIDQEGDVEKEPGTGQEKECQSECISGFDLI